MKLLQIINLHTSFFTHIGEVKAVRGISLELSHGGVLGIVGESGCGKSVSMLSVTGLLAETGKITEGQVIFEDRDITKYTDKQMARLRGNEISMIFQDPMTSLNPLLSIGSQLTEHLIKHKRVTRGEARKRALDMLRLVGIPDAEKRINQYPHEFSGGMRQRAMIAASLICRPKLIIADEPTTALDVTIQAQILDLMKDLRARLDTSIILITHDLGVVADICSRVAVMYGGLIVELGPARDIFYHSRHPYTLGLMKSVPNPRTKSAAKEKLKPIDGQPPDLFKPPPGCPFAPRCDYAMKICLRAPSPFYKISEEHDSACFLNDRNASVTAPWGKEGQS
ncbi:MAG: ABC transporter ATP-binding protein [Clostridiales bacterium]|jgi:oligopeptide transport system ATP-binding protein|nr:ABC transporter ATP-binding protein [Clostridiales bacterium]